ncbi:hypothetical protein ILUMI_10915 [Ignelater luminosus]|uniref:Mutator-like transposase domain-containing protein n=1 Tax=Ignelater luminosus TaxID=2038154 RepID=A0A8K0G2D2_IGNLU|nr:hypothetical protein ILUMI_16943 [Ignelater luminosus]KAF2895266.1 hypothetical protein ILUMI_10915 [Ignelater luminosus]
MKSGIKGLTYYPTPHLLGLSWLNKQNRRAYLYIIFLELERETCGTPPVLDGNRIVDISYFIEEVKKIGIHDSTCTMGKMKFIKEHRRRVTSKLLFGCDTCKTLHVQTQPENTVETSNEALVWGSLSIGIGFSQLQELLSVLNTPTMAKKTYNRYEINVWKEWKD